MRSSRASNSYRHAETARAVKAAAMLLAAVLSLASANGVQAVGRVQIGAGSSVNFSDGEVRMGCGDFAVEDGGAAAIGAGTLGRVRDVRVESATGALTMATGLLAFSGTWAVEGTFEPGSGTVAVVDGCTDGPAVVTGNNGFYNFTITSDRGKEARFEAGTTQSVRNRFEAAGKAGMRTVLRSTEAGRAAHICLDPGGAQYVDWVDVADSRVPDLEQCQRLAPGEPGDHNSVDSGDTFGWFDNIGGLPVPALGLAGASVLALFLFLLGGRAIRRL